MKTTKKLWNISIFHIDYTLKQYYLDLMNVIKTNFIKIKNLSLFIFIMLLLENYKLHM